MRLWLLLALLPAPVAAQVSYPPSSVDTSNLATKPDVAAVQAAIPPVCSTAPAKDTLNGSVGSAAPCTPAPDNTRPTAVQRANTSLAADCTWSVAFSRAFTSSTPIVHASIILAAATMPMPCIVLARSTTAANGKCFPAQTSLLNLSIITAGLTLAPFGTT
jgi:hypothetical protein